MGCVLTQYIQYTLVGFLLMDVLVICLRVDVVTGAVMDATKADYTPAKEFIQLIQL